MVHGMVEVMTAIFFFKLVPVDGLRVEHFLLNVLVTLQLFIGAWQVQK